MPKRLLQGIVVSDKANKTVVVDVGAEYGQYTADVTRTMPVNGKFTQRQKAIYDLVLGTQQAAMDSARSGVTIRDLNREGLTCVLVEQNVAVSLKLATRGYVLENGRITLSGSGPELLAHDRVRQAYLGI